MSPQYDSIGPRPTVCNVLCAQWGECVDYLKKLASILRRALIALIRTPYRIFRRAEALPPTFVASFLMICITSLFSWHRAHPNLTSNQFIDAVLLLTVLANLLFFFGYEFYTDRDPELLAKLRNVPGEWYLRLASHLILLCMGLSLEIGTSFFLLAFLAFYVCILWWDVLVFKWEGVCEALHDASQNPFNIIVCDIAGMITTIFFTGVVSASMLSNGESVFGLSPSVVSAIKQVLNPLVEMLLLGICVAIYWLIVIVSLRSAQGTLAQRRQA